MIFMRGLKAVDLEAIMDFIYYGETNIYHEGLDRFLTLAQELQLKGLAKSEDTSLDSPEEALTEQEHPKSHQSFILKQENHLQLKDKAVMHDKHNSTVAVDFYLFIISKTMQAGIAAH